MNCFRAAIVVLTTGMAQAECSQDGQLNILMWQAPSTLNPYLSGGSKDVYATSMVLEPVARYYEKGEMLPNLATEIPTLENGGVSDDLMSITWKLKDGIKWSDGTDLTAQDVILTWQYCSHPDSGCAQSNYYAEVKDSRGARSPDRQDHLQSTDTVPLSALRW